MSGGLSGYRRWIVAAAVAMVVGALAWPWMAASLASRAVELSFTVRGDGPVELRWVRPAAAGGGSNGIWIDVKDPAFARAPEADGSRRCALVQATPSYAVERLELRAESGAGLAVGTANLRTWVLGIRQPTVGLRAEQAGDVVSLGGLPPIWRQTLWPGVIAGALLGAYAVALAGGGVFIVGLYEAWRGRHRGWVVTSPTRRIWGIAAVIVCVLAPLQMALWSPVFILADSTAYVWFAHDLLKSGTLEHFDGWRLPGYALLLAGAMSRVADYAVVVGLVQCVCASVTGLLVYDMLRKRLGGLWAPAAAMVVALDPVLLGWTRVLMPEAVSSLLITLAGWLFLRVIERGEGRAGVARAVGIGVLLGAVCGAACWVRGNNQVVPAVLVAGLVWCGFARRHWALVAGAGGVVAAAFAVMLPIFFVNARNHERFAFTVGRNFTRSLFSWENGTTDWNQSGTLSLAEFFQLRDKLRLRPMTDWEVMGWLASTKTVPVPPGTDRWLTQELRCAALVNEAQARNGPLFALRQAQAAAILLGIPITQPTYGVRGTWAIFTQLRGRENGRTTTNFDFRLDAFPPAVRADLERSIHDVGGLKGHPVARVYGAWFNLWRWLRAGFAGAFVFALARLIVRREWAFTALGLVVLANVVGVPVLTYAAEYRYAAPYYALMATVMAYGLGWPGRGTRNL